jgi:ATP-dependent DNA helicase RecQ
VAVNMLKEAGIVHEGRGARFTLVRREVPGTELEQLAGQYERRGQSDRERLERIIQYAQSALCRWKIVAEYFGEAVEWERCGHCDACEAPMEREIKAPETRSPLPPPQAHEQEASSSGNGAGGPSTMKEGTLVRLPDHGEGEVLEVQGDKILVRFPDGGQKLFKREFAEAARQSR